MLACKFHMCTEDIKIALFKAYCNPMYTTQLQEAYNDAFRILLKLFGLMQVSSKILFIHLHLD